MSTRKPTLLLCASLIAGCRGDQVGEPTKPPRPQVDFEDVPESDLTPRDPAVEAREAELSTLQDLGLEYELAIVDSPESLKELGLKPGTEDDARLLGLVVETISAGLAESTYVLLFDPEPETAVVPQILGPTAHPLVSIARIDRAVPTCTTMVSTQIQDGENEVGYGARIGTLTEGICGGIAVLHSWIELGITTLENASDGGEFKPKAVSAAQGSNRRSMTHRDLRRRHEQYGATDCRTQPGNGGQTASQTGLQKFIDELDSFVNDPDNTWDCTLFVRTRGEGGDVLAHFEHVQSLTRTNGGATIATTNGFHQGNGTTTVPTDPGTNTWTATPGGTPAFGLTSTTATQPPNLVESVPNVGLVNYLCCKFP